MMGILEFVILMMADDAENKKMVNKTSQFNEPAADYEKAEMDLLRDALKRSDTERFLFTTMLYKVQQTLKKAKITHKPDNLDK